MRALVFLLVITLLWSVPAVGEIYKWRDANGVVHFQDKPPENIAPATKLETMADSVYGKGTGSGAEPEGRNPASTVNGPSATVPAKVAANGTAKVEVYLTSWCPWCKKTVEFFHSRGIKVLSYDIEKDPSAARRKDRLDPRKGVPTTVVNGQVIHGYAPGAFEKALKNTR